MTDNEPTMHLDETIKLLSQALHLADASNYTLVAAHIQMALDAANRQNVELNR